MLWLLIKNKINCVFNGYFHGPFKRRSFRYLTLAVSGFFFYYLFSWSKDFFRIILQSPELNLALVERIELIEHILSAGFTGFFFFLLMGGLTLSIHYIFSGTDDLSLLLTTPLSNYTIFSYKIIETIVFNSALFFFIGFSTLLGFGVGVEAQIEDYFVLIGTLIPFVIIPTTFALLLSILAVQIISPQRIREISGALTGLITLGFWFIIQIFRVSAFDRDSPDFDPMRFEQLEELAHRSFGDFLPSGWVSTVFTSFLQEDKALPWLHLLGLYLLAIVLFAACLFLIQRSFLKGIALVDTSTFKKNKGQRKQGAVGKLIEGKPSVYLCVIRKDIKLILRDSRLVMQTVMLGIMMVFVSIIIDPGDTTGLPDFIGEAYRFLFILLFSSIASAQMGSRLIPLERQAFWRLKLAPNPMRRIVISKLFLGYVITQLVTMIALAIVSVYYHQAFEMFLALFIFSMPICLGASALGGLLGSLFPRFDWEHPKRMLTPMGGILLVVGALVWWIISLTLIFVPPVLFNSTMIFHPLNGLLCAIVAVLMSFIAIWWQAERLESMEWQY